MLGGGGGRCGGLREQEMACFFCRLLPFGFDMVWRLLFWAALCRADWHLSANLSLCRKQLSMFLFGGQEQQQQDAQQWET